VEGAEDDASQAAEDLHRLGPGEHDVVVCVAASGRTPYVLGALQHARACGALTIGIASNAGSPLAAAAEVGITLDTGAEVISGSTRLKAGTAQKIALNTLSSALMVRLHKVFGNLMVDLRASNAKLIARAERLTVLATGCAPERARDVLAQCGWHVKTAIVAIDRDVDVAHAARLLDAAGGDTWAVLSAPR
jgi:N-acetylmuramic acid 6-phosphate etherase